MKKEFNINGQTFKEGDKISCTIRDTSILDGELVETGDKWYIRNNIKSGANVSCGKHSYSWFFDPEQPEHDDVKEMELLNKEAMYDIY